GSLEPQGIRERSAEGAGEGVVMVIGPGSDDREVAVRTQARRGPALFVAQRRAETRSVLKQRGRQGQRRVGPGLRRRQREAPARKVRAVLPARSLLGVSRQPDGPAVARWLTDGKRRAERTEGAGEDARRGVRLATAGEEVDRPSRGRQAE